MLPLGDAPRAVSKTGLGLVVSRSLGCRVLDNSVIREMLFWWSYLRFN